MAERASRFAGRDLSVDVIDQLMNVQAEQAMLGTRTG